MSLVRGYFSQNQLGVGAGGDGFTQTCPLSPSRQSHPSVERFHGKEVVRACGAYAFCDDKNKIQSPHHQLRPRPHTGKWRAAKACCAAGISAYVETMDWQQLVSLMIVAVAAGLLLRKCFARRRFSFLRDRPCGCQSMGGDQSRSSIVFRARKGERREIVVKMR